MTASYTGSYDASVQDTRYRTPPRQARPLHRPSRQPRARRPARWGRRLKVVALIILVVAIAGLALLWQRATAFNDAVSTQPSLSMRAFGPFSEERVNVLLLGYSDESREGAFLTDSMNMLSIDKATDTTTLIAIPRDMWVEGMAEIPQNMKINEAFRIGYYEDGLEAAAELASRAVTHVTGLPIHGWISLDFQGFEAMVDAIGGITVDNPTAFAYAWDEASWLAGEFVGSYEAGVIRLNGEQALNYSRNRYTSVVEESSDFARSVRQQRVLAAIRGEITGWMTLGHGLAIATALEDHMHTNLPVVDLAILAGKLQADRRLALDTQLVATTNTIGQYVLVVARAAAPADYGPLQTYIAEELSAAPVGAPTE